MIPGVRGRVADSWENSAGESSGVEVKEGSRKASGVFINPLGMGGEEGGCEANGVSGNLGGGLQGV